MRPLGYDNTYSCCYSGFGEPELGGVTVEKLEESKTRMVEREGDSCTSISIGQQSQTLSNLLRGDT